MRHGRTESVKDGSFKAHVNVAADFPHLRSHGLEELDVGDED
jgi:hypothetical protein